MEGQPEWGSGFRGAKRNGRRGKGLPTGCFPPFGGELDGTIRIHSLTSPFPTVHNEWLPYLGPVKTLVAFVQFGQAFPKMRMRLGVGNCEFQ